MASAMPSSLNQSVVLQLLSVGAEESFMGSFPVCIAKE